MLTDLGKALILFGIVLGAVGALLVAAGRIPWLGRLPGDIVIRREHFTFVFPLASCLVVSGNRPRSSRWLKSSGRTPAAANFLAYAGTLS